MTRLDLPREPGEIIYHFDVNRSSIALAQFINTALNLETVDIVVHSPNWKRDGRNWQADANKHQGKSFSIEDEGFWQRIDQRDVDLKAKHPRQHTRAMGLPSWSSEAIAHKSVSRPCLRRTSTLMPMTNREIQALQSMVHFVEPDTRDLFDECRGSNGENGEGTA